MSTLSHPHSAAQLQAATRRHLGDVALNKVVARVRASRALADLLPSLFLSGVLTAVAVAALQLTWYGPIPGFAAQWLESWLIAWPIAFPVAYFSGPMLLTIARFVSTPDVSAQGLAFNDIASASARATARHGFTVLRNLKVREDFDRA